MTISDNVRSILISIGEDPDREGLKETPERVEKAYRELFSGYQQKPADILKEFEEPYDEMVVLRDINFTSFCEHHILPFSGVISVAYIPKGKVVGVSKLARLCEMYTKRLQIQERLTRQITEALNLLEPLGSACVVKATHSCMSCRGVRNNGVMVTSSLTGEFLKGEVRSEFLKLIE